MFATKGNYAEKSMLHWYWSYCWPKGKREYLCILKSGEYIRKMQVVKYKGDGEWATPFKVLAWADPIAPKFVFQRAKKEDD